MRLGQFIPKYWILRLVNSRPHPAHGDKSGVCLMEQGQAETNTFLGNDVAKSWALNGLFLAPPVLLALLGEMDSSEEEVEGARAQ